MQAPHFWQTDGLLPRLFSPAAWAYGIGVDLRRVLAGAPSRLRIPIICVGNIVAGGAGKTPVARDLGARLCDQGKTPHFLTRGYGGLERGPLRVEVARHSAVDVGDEALLLAHLCPTWVAVDRLAGCKAAVDAGAEVIVMDDGFQNPSVCKDVSLLVVDGEYGLGNQRLIPAGPMRERTADALKRTDAVVVIGDDETGFRSHAENAGIPCLRADMKPEEPAKVFAVKPIIAFTGIGRPKKFFRTLREIGCDVRNTHPYPDHFPFRSGEIDRLKEEARLNDAVLVTTEKDATRIEPAALDGIEVLTITLKWEDEAALDDVLRTALD